MYSINEKDYNKIGPSITCSEINYCALCVTLTSGYRKLLTLRSWKLNTLLQVCMNKYDLLNHNKLVFLVIIIISRHSHLISNKRPLQLLNWAGLSQTCSYTLILWFKGKISPKHIELLESFKVFSAVKMRLDCLNKLAVRCEEVFHEQITLSVYASGLGGY